MLQYLESLVCIARRDTYLDEYLVHLFGSSGINFLVCYMNTTKCAHGITSECCLESLDQCRTRCQTASIVVLHDDECRLVKVHNQVNCSVNVEQIVIRNFFAMQLSEH